MDEEYRAVNRARTAAASLKTRNVVVIADDSAAKRAQLHEAYARNSGAGARKREVCPAAA